MKRRILALLCILALLAGCAAMPPAISPSPSVAADAGCAVYFLDVGQADSILVCCDGHNLLIDGGNVEDSDCVVSALRVRNVSSLDAIVCTHAHEDHVGGLTGVIEQFDAKVFYAPVADYDSAAFRNLISAVETKGLPVTIPCPGDTFSLGGAELTVLGPIAGADESVNNTSIVLRMVYGESSFLFAGDCSREEEQAILGSGRTVRADVLKVGHHGSDSSTTYPFLRAVAPSFAVISVGADNDYGLPDDAVLSRLRDADVTLYRTDLQGTVTCRSNGKNITFSVETGDGVQTNPTGVSADSSAAYIGNLSSRIFHLPTCSDLPAEQNRAYFSSREEAVAAGYSPCKVCCP